MPNDPAIGPSGQDTPSDYAAALATTLHVKSWVISLLLALVIGELSLFFLFRYCDTWQPRAVDLLKYCVGIVQFLGLCMALLLTIDLVLALNITLAGRLGGATHLVRAAVWSTIALLLLFPWQAFLINQQFTSSAFKIPGVLFSWQELIALGRWDAARADFWTNFLRWARFVGFPMVAVIVIIGVAFHSSRGGEQDPDKIV